MKLTLFLLATAFSCTWALTCKSCDDNPSAAKPACTAATDLVCSNSNGGTESCYTTWEVTTAGAVTYTNKGCSSTSFVDSDESEDCDLSWDSRGMYNGGTCNCKGDRCNNAPPSILESDDDRLKCYHCPYSSTKLDCNKQDRYYNNFGSEVVCPKGVRYCSISADSDHKSFFRGCHTKLYDDMDDDDDYMGLGYCVTIVVLVAKTNVTLVFTE